MTKLLRNDWTSGTKVLNFLRCVECANVYYLPMAHCSDCNGAVEVRDSLRRGICIAASDVPDKYSSGGSAEYVCMVLLDEGFRILGVRALGVVVGDRVVIGFVEGDGGDLRPVASKDHDFEGLIHTVASDEDLNMTLPRRMDSASS